AVIAANGGRVPATGRELYDALERLGDFAHLSVPFSAVALDSGLSHPRVVIARRPPPSPDPRARPTDRPDPLPGTPADRPDLEGRLFLAANTTTTGPTTARRAAPSRSSP